MSSSSPWGNWTAVLHLPTNWTNGFQGTSQFAGLTTCLACRGHDLNVWSYYSKFPSLLRIVGFEAWLLLVYLFYMISYLCNTNFSALPIFSIFFPCSFYQISLWSYLKFSIRSIWLAEGTPNSIEIESLILEVAKVFSFFLSCYWIANINSSFIHPL